LLHIRIEIAMTPSYEISNVECLNLEKSTHSISTGVGFLDHMLDQFNSHAQVGVAVSVVAAETNTEDHNRYAAYSQETLQNQVGAALGAQLKTILTNVPDGAQSRFCCPLDEALVECILTKGSGKLIEFTLPPYGVYPRPHGRTRIGQMETGYIQNFMTNLAQQSGLDMQLRKIRGVNGHHIVESAFKALSRSLRNLLDGTNTNINAESPVMRQQWGVNSESHRQSLQLQRSGKVERQTKETSILVELHFDDGSRGVSVETGIATLNEFWTVLAVEANVSLTVQCNGDLWVDDHHTSEDVAIAVGQVLTKAFGTKAGLNRMWCARGQIGGGCGLSKEDYWVVYSCGMRIILPFVIPCLQRPTWR
jgi:imidazoleglycerol-phosphate dehydratase